MFALVLILNYLVMKALFIFLSTVFLFISCNKKINGEDSKDIFTFSEYILPDNTCKWKNIESVNNNPTHEMIIIHNEAELLSQIECGDFSSDIDFTTHSLILVRGVSNYYTSVDNFSVEEMSDANYNVFLTMKPSGATAITYWQIAILVNRSISVNDNIEISITNTP